MAQLRALPARTQITRHDCVEGWSAIGQWTGPQLGGLLKAARPLPQARYAVFYCADNLEGEPAKGGEQAPGPILREPRSDGRLPPPDDPRPRLNGAPLDVPYGAPAAPAGRAPARLQAGQVRPADPARRQPGRHQRRQGRLLGGSRLRVVRRDLRRFRRGARFRTTGTGGRRPRLPRPRGELGKICVELTPP